MIPHLAKEVGPSGHVYGFDISLDILARAKERITSEKLNNDTLVERDLTTMAFHEQAPDVIHSRFIFMHLQNPENVIKNLKQVLKPGGIIILQESALKEIGASHPLDDLKNYRDALIALGREKQLDFNLGEKLEKIAENSGFRVLNVDSILLNGSGKESSELLRIRIKSTSPELLDAKIATEEQVKRWKTIPEQITELSKTDPKFYTNPGRLYSVIVQKEETTA